MFGVAYYTGTRPGLSGVYNKIVRKFESGPYSHCELVFSDGASASSSYMDGGVRFCGAAFDHPAIDFDNGNWVFIPLPLHYEAAARAWFIKHVGKSYDLRGNLRFVFPWGNRDSRDKWYCNEAILAALGVPEPWRYGVNTSAGIVRVLALGVAPQTLAVPAPLTQ